MAHACTRRTRFPAFARPSASTRPESTRERKPVQLLQRLPETGYGLIRPRIPPLDMQDEAAGPQNPPWLQGPAGSKNGTPPCGFDDERIYCRHEAAGTGQNGTGQRGQNGRSGTRQRGRNGRSCTRQSGQNGRSGVSAAGSGDNGANGRKRTNSRVRAVNGNAPDRPG